MVGTLRFAYPTHPNFRHCEERSDEAIHAFSRQDGLLRFARNDDVTTPPPSAAAPPAPSQIPHSPWPPHRCRFAGKTDPADIGHEDPRLAGDVGAHVPGIGLRIERGVGDLVDMGDPFVFGV